MALQKLTGRISLQILLKVMFLSGVVIGLLVAPFYSISYFSNGEIFYGLLTLVLTPLCNGIFSAMYALVGYPIYKLAVEKGVFGLNEISVVSE